MDCRTCANAGHIAKGKRWRRLRVLLKYYGHRIAGTSLSWFVWDFGFYGNKVSELGLP